MEESNSHSYARILVLARTIIDNLPYCLQGIPRVQNGWVHRGRINHLSVTFSSQLKSVILAGGRQCSDAPGFSGMPGSSRICTAVAEPRVFQSCRTQTTFLSRVIS